MNLKEAILKEVIKILAQFEELFGDGGNGGDSKEEKETKRQFPEAWETEANEIDWAGIPKEIRKVIGEVGDDPNEILEWGIRNGSEEEIVRWALGNGADINKLGKREVISLCRYLPVDFLEEIIKNYVTDERLRQLMYDEMLIEGIGRRDKDKVKVALENGVDISELNKEGVISLCRHLPVDFLEEIIKNYVTNEGLKRFMYNGMLMGGIESEDEDKVKVALENGADINKLDRREVASLCYRFSADFLEEIIKNYVTNEGLKRFMYNGMLMGGIESEDEDKVKVALENGADVSELDRKRVASLCYNLPVSSLEKIIKNYVMDEELKQFIYDEMLKGGIWRGDEYKVKIALENGANINEADNYYLRCLGEAFSYDFVKEIEEKYVTNRKAKQIIYEEAFVWAVKGMDEDVVREILATKKIDVDKLSSEEEEEWIWEEVAKAFSADFLKEIVLNYGVRGKARDILLEEILRSGLREGHWRNITQILDILLENIFRKGLKEGRREDVIWALKKGVKIDERDKEKLNTLLGPDWGKYLPRRR